MSNRPETDHAGIPWPPREAPLAIREEAVKARLGLCCEDWDFKPEDIDTIFEMYDRGVVTRVISYQVSPPEIEIQRRTMTPVPQSEAEMRWRRAFAVDGQMFIDFYRWHKAAAANREEEAERLRNSFVKDWQDQRQNPDNQILLRLLRRATEVALQKH